MPTERTSAATVLIIVLLAANLGLSGYIALRQVPMLATAASNGDGTSDITPEQARKLSEALIPLYNQKDISALYDRFDPLAKVQITKEQVATQIEKLLTLLGQVESSAYSHATVAGTQEGRTYYTLHYKLRLSGGQLPTGNLTLTVARTGDQLGLFGFYIGGNSGQVSQ